MTEPLGLPEFLRIPQTRRREAWAKFTPHGRAEQTGSTGHTGPMVEPPKPWDDPGSVARGLGYPESEAEREARLLYHARRREERERKAVVEEKRKEEADDASIFQAAIEHRRELRAKELKALRAAPHHDGPERKAWERRLKKKQLVKRK